MVCGPPTTGPCDPEQQLLGLLIQPVANSHWWGCTLHAACAAEAYQSGELQELLERLKNE